ncbi:MAG TPA: hypothetical protein PKA64_05800 [Myxococcota bacterium]|nr:hypothetical protein [Myxococcota bacterium]
MTDTLRRAAILIALAAGTTANAGDIYTWTALGTGYRHSFGLDAGGLSIAGYLGVQTGWFGVEYESQWSNDHTLKPPEDRLAARNTNWLNILIAPIHAQRMRLMLDVGPGLGWIRPPGKVAAPSRSMSWGLHEHLRLDFRLGDDDVSAFVGFRVGAMHLWQDTLAPPVEHGFDAMILIGFGPSFR